MRPYSGLSDPNTDLYNAFNMSQDALTSGPQDDNSMFNEAVLRSLEELLSCEAYTLPQAQEPTPYSIPEAPPQSIGVPELGQLSRETIQMLAASHLQLLAQQQAMASQQQQQQQQQAYSRPPSTDDAAMFVAQNNMRWGGHRVVALPGGEPMSVRPHMFSVDSALSPGRSPDLDPFTSQPMQVSSPVHPSQLHGRAVLNQLPHSTSNLSSLRLDADRFFGVHEGPVSSEQVSFMSQQVPGRSANHITSLPTHGRSSLNQLSHSTNNLSSGRPEGDRIFLHQERPLSPPSARNRGGTYGVKGRTGARQFVNPAPMNRSFNGPVRAAAPNWAGAGWDPMRHSQHNRKASGTGVFLPHLEANEPSGPPAGEQKQSPEKQSQQEPKVAAVQSDPQSNESTADTVSAQLINSLRLMQ